MVFLNILDTIKYTTNFNFPCFFLYFFMWLPEHLKLHTWLALHLYWTVLPEEMNTLHEDRDRNQIFPALSLVLRTAPGIEYMLDKYLLNE